MDVTKTFTREQAIKTGRLVDVTDLATQEGLRFPTAFTQAVWERCVPVSGYRQIQDHEGHMREVLSALAREIDQHLAKHPKFPAPLFFLVYFDEARLDPNPITFVAVFELGNDDRPAVTIKLFREC